MVPFDSPGCFGPGHGDITPRRVKLGLFQQVFLSSLGLVGECLYIAHEACKQGDRLVV